MSKFSVLLGGIILFTSVALEHDPSEVIIPNKKDVECMSLNIYHEARNQGTAGIFAVMAVVLNRMNDDRFPDTICGVVKQGPIRPSWKNNGTFFPIKNKCQFSWWCDGKSDKPLEVEKYNYYTNVVREVLSYELDFVDITDGATFYHADYVTPSWARTKIKTVEIEDHIFYKWE